MANSASKQDLARRGYAIEELPDTSPKVYLYKLESTEETGGREPQWNKHGPFPQAMVRTLLARGFRYTPEPSQVEEAKVEVETKAEPFECGICKKVCKNQIGLISHQKTHKKE